MQNDLSAKASSLNVMYWAGMIASVSTSSPNTCAFPLMTPNSFTENPAVAVRFTSSPAPSRRTPLRGSTIGTLAGMPLLKSSKASILSCGIAARSSDGSVISMLKEEAATVDADATDPIAPLPMRLRKFRFWEDSQISPSMARSADTPRQYAHPAAPTSNPARLKMSRIPSCSRVAIMIVDPGVTFLLKGAFPLPGSLGLGVRPLFIPASSTRPARMISASVVVQAPMKTPSRYLIVSHTFFPLSIRGSYNFGSLMKNVLSGSGHFATRGLTSERSRVRCWWYCASGSARMYTASSSLSGRCFLFATNAAVISSAGKTPAMAPNSVAMLEMANLESTDISAMFPPNSTTRSRATEFRLNL
mmetsp:Transcript_44259/g.87338  ORF Transcript_44259/g.87338 Transcript_44259/m.87338 type:complete len:360 (-) Transcript_44259:758-1837(-)